MGMVIGVAVTACSGGLQGLPSGGALDGPGGSNQAAPMQVSGSKTPNFDPNDLDREGYYHFSLSDSFAQKPFEGTEAVVTLAGTLKKFPTIQEVPRYIKIVDRRSSRYLVSELSLEGDSPSTYRFKANLHGEPLSFDDVFKTKNQVISFFVAPSFPIVDSLDEEKSCDGDLCHSSGEPWAMLTPDAVEGNAAFKVTPVWTGEEGKKEINHFQDLPLGDEKLEGPIQIPGSK
ncbi:MAG: hypothetical protein IT572_05650 [Deltaproteobacteria bacterium]|nr:hypothetical protein [Deltaproteobacteria bacterium]